MSFQEDFSADLSHQGVNLPAASIPRREVLEQGFTKLNDFVNSLDADTAEALGAVTQEFPVKALLASPEVGVAPELATVLAAFDQSQAPFSISQVAEVGLRILGMPTGPRGQVKRPDAPRITSVQPVQVNLRDHEPRIFVSWSMRDACDKFHFMWTDRTPPPANGDLWSQVELTPGRTLESSFNIPKTSAGKTYTFKVQGCDSRLLGHDNCSPFTDDRSITMPANTHSLKTFLSISNLPLNRGVRFLGTSVFGNGLRAMMRI